jgi:8-oxo-dGTP pyrophosphatase MutT (NUDIX family)
MPEDRTRASGPDPFAALSSSPKSRWVIARGRPPRADALNRMVLPVVSSQRERSYIPVENPADRPRTSRATVRVILIDSDRTLLFEDSDPGVPEASWWVTPGGGVDDGESEVQAAIREVAEETGCLIRESDLQGPIAKRHVVHGYSDQVIEQDESFYLAMVPPFEVDVSAFTEDEQITIKQFRWWTHDDLRQTSEWIWPHELVELWSLAGDRSSWPVDLGTQEESTVLDVP